MIVRAEYVAQDRDTVKLGLVHWSAASVKLALNCTRPVIYPGQGQSNDQI